VGSGANAAKAAEEMGRDILPDRETEGIEFISGRGIR
jgi:hypothetical protein